MPKEKEWVFNGSVRLWHKFDSDILRRNYMDWIRNIDIRCWQPRAISRVEWGFMGSGRFWHKYDRIFDRRNQLDWKNRNIDILSSRNRSCLEFIIVFMGSGRSRNNAYDSDIARGN